MYSYPTQIVDCETARTETDMTIPAIPCEWEEYSIR